MHAVDYSAMKGNVLLLCAAMQMSLKHAHQRSLTQEYTMISSIWSCRTGKTNVGENFRTVVNSRNKEERINWKVAQKNFLRCW